MKKQQIFTIAICAIIYIMFHVNPVFAETKPVPNIHVKNLEAFINGDFNERIVSDDEYFLVKEKLTNFDEGFFLIRDSISKKQDKAYSFSQNIEGDNLKIKYVDNDGNLIVLAYGQADLPNDKHLYLETDKCHMLVSPAHQYSYFDMGMYIRNEHVIPIKIKDNGGSYEITHEYPATKGARNEMWVMSSTKPLFDFTKKEQIWHYSRYDLCEKSAILIDGYYYEYPEQKKFKGVFFKSPSPYLAKSFVLTGNTPLTIVLGKSLVDLAMGNINEHGYFPVFHKSEWLKKDYDISPPYFDNRWNSDLAWLLLETYNRYGEKKYLDTFMRQYSFFKNYVDTHSVITRNGGYLNYDYGDEKLNPKNHVALNHQISVIFMFYKAYELLDLAEAKQYGDKLMKGLESIGKKWIKPDGSYHYAYMINGNLGMEDYPTLTYNDIFVLQNLYIRNNMSRSQFLDSLMKPKKVWMDKNGYSGKYYTNTRIGKSVLYGNNPRSRQYKAELGDKLKTIGIIAGNSNGDLMIDNKLTREQALIVLLRMTGKYDTALHFGDSESFVDIKYDYYKPFISYAKANGISNGISKDEFGFGKAVSARDLLAFFMRAVGIGDLNGETYDTIHLSAESLGLLTNFYSDIDAPLKRGDSFILINNIAEKHTRNQN